VSIPVNARVRAVPNFLVCLQAARTFMEEQDAASASARFKKLQAEIVKARALVSFAPTSGRPARFLDAESGWASFSLSRQGNFLERLGNPSCESWCRLGTSCSTPIPGQRWCCSHCDMSVN